MRALDSDERGLALVWTTVSLLVLLALGGFAVDLGQWYLKISQLQRAADAAALAGSVYLPEDPERARDVARAELANNGIDDPSEIRTIEPMPDAPNQLKVVVASTVDNVFIDLLSSALRTQHLERTAIGQYYGPIGMGSPSNVLGQEPAGMPSWETPGLAGTQGDYWLNVSGGVDNKVDGDRWLADDCSGADYCSGGRNDEYRPQGQEYLVRVPEGLSGNLAIEAYDAPLVVTEENCDINMSGASSLMRPGDPPGLFDQGRHQYCNGDERENGGAPTSTTYSLWTPATSAGGSTQIAGCQTTFLGWNTDVSGLVNPPSGYQLTADGFHRWFRLCNIPIGTSGFEAGDYLLKVTTERGRGGANHFSLRAAFLDSSGVVDAVSTANISFMANGRLTIFANAGGATTQFYLSRIAPRFAGNTLNFDLYDLGDSGGSADIVLLPPTDAMSGGGSLTAFANCSIAGPESDRTPRDDPSVVVPDCSIHGATSSRYDGQIVRVSVPVPADYTCDSASPSGCWFRLNVRYNSADVYDTTSWQASLPGRLVRLVPNR